MEKSSLTALARHQLDIARNASSGRSAATVYGGHEHVLRQTLIALVAGQMLDEHENPGEATLHVLHGRVRLVSAETSWEGTPGDLLKANRPYERPPLSKEYLQGSAGRDTIFVHPERWYTDHDVNLRLATSATAVDTAAHEVALADGSRVGYTKLLLATGSSPRRLPAPGADLDGVHYLRTVEDSDRIRVILDAQARVVVIGAGWIGLEVAAAARRAGASVTVLETDELPLLRVLGREMAAVFAGLHRRHGVDLQCGVQVAEIVGRDGRAHGVHLADGTVVEADAVIVGIGIVPNTDLAHAAGLETDDGIRVDQFLRSSDPDIYAAGDVASAFHPLFDRHIRVEHWANAKHAGPAAAPRHARPGRGVRPVALLLHRPVRPRDGIHRPHRTPRLRPGRGPWRPRHRAVHRLLARRGSRPGRDERQHLGRHRRHRATGPHTRRRRPRPARRPVHTSHRPVTDGSAAGARWENEGGHLRGISPAEGARVQVGRVYDERTPADGARVLVDRIWARWYSIVLPDHA